MSTSVTTPADLFITVGAQRRIVALATGLHLSSQRIDHLIWFSRLIRQGRGVTAATRADALHDLGMGPDQWKAFSVWIRDEGWFTATKTLNSSFIWCNGPRWDSTDWAAIAAQAEADHNTSRSGLNRRPAVKAAIDTRSSGVSPATEQDSSGPSGTTELNSSGPSGTTEQESSGPSGATASGPSGTTEIAETPGTNSDLSPLIPHTHTSLGANTSLGTQSSSEEQPSAEVEPQASGFASGPAEIPANSQQPEEESTTINNENESTENYAQPGLDDMLNRSHARQAQQKMKSVEPEQPQLNSEDTQHLNELKSVLLNSIVECCDSKGNISYGVIDYVDLAMQEVISLELNDDKSCYLPSVERNVINVESGYWGGWSLHLDGGCPVPFNQHQAKRLAQQSASSDLDSALNDLDEAVAVVD